MCVHAYVLLPSFFQSVCSVHWHHDLPGSVCVRFHLSVRWVFYLFVLHTSFFALQLELHGGCSQFSPFVSRRLNGHTPRLATGGAGLTGETMVPEAVSNFSITNFMFKRSML